MRTHRLLWQLIFAVLAALCVAALSVLLITEAVSHAQRIVIAETSQALTTADAEMLQQYQYRINADPSWHILPATAKDISLRGITLTVLRSYPGTEGGFFRDHQFLGYAFPTHYRGEMKTDVPGPEKNEIQTLAEAAIQTRAPQQKILEEGPELVVIHAVSDPSHPIAIWTMKRLQGEGTPGERRRWLLAALVIAALGSIFVTLFTGIGLYRSIAHIQSGLARLEQDFTFHLQETPDELGQISRSINQMSRVRRNLENQLRREDRLRAMGRLAAGMAHEIRNPLNSIRLAMQLLEQRLRVGTAQSGDIHIVIHEVDRMNELITGLLDLQRTRPPNPKLQPLQPVLERCVALLSAKAAAQQTPISLMVGQTLQASFDEGQFTQVLVNLLLNALDASPEGSRIEVQTEANGDMVDVTVTDHGLGLTPEQQEHLFEAFYTTKPHGLGLGLAISRELMRGQNGDVLYQPAEHGTTFTIRIPSHSLGDQPPRLIAGSNKMPSHGY